MNFVVCFLSRKENLAALSTRNFCLEFFSRDFNISWLRFVFEFPRSGKFTQNRLRFDFHKIVLPAGSEEP